ncbi:MAG: HPP family protein [Halopenitus sp.]
MPWFDPELASGWLAAQRRHLRRSYQRRLAAAGRWLENTENLLHVSVLVFVPLLVAVVTGLSNALAELSFLLFPPLASGAYTLFAHPEGEYASPVRFVAGLTLGALSGWAALLLSGSPSGVIPPTSAGLAIFLVGAVTWAFDVEEPAAFSTALLVLVTRQASPKAYVASVTVFGALVAGAFSIWRRRVYEQRATFLYGTVRADDHVLVPLVDGVDSTLAAFGGRLAAAHDAGKIVLLDVVSEQEVAAAERAAVATEESSESETAGLEATDSSDVAGDESATANPESEATKSLPDGVRQRVTELETTADRLRHDLDVACEVAVAAGDPFEATRRTAREANCDLVIPPFSDATEPFVQQVFESNVDTVALRAADGHESWRRVLVMVARPGDTAHAMVDFAERLAGEGGRVSVCTCIDSERERRRAEEKLARVSETETTPIETRVIESSPGDFCASAAGFYDLILVGATRGEGPLLSVFSTEDLERLDEVDCDLGIVERGPLR